MRATVKLVLRNDYVRKDGKQQLCLRYIAYQKDSYIGLGISVHPKHWDKNALMVRLGERLAPEYNGNITDVYLKARNIIKGNYNSPLTIQEFRTHLFERKEEPQIDFYEFVEQELEVLKVDRAEGTIANYRKLINTMKEWKSTLLFHEITLDYIEKFHAHEREQGNLESTVNKKHANFKFLIGRAVLKEKLERNPYERFTIKKKIDAQNEDVLTEKEIDKKEYLLLCNKRAKNGMPYKIPIVSDKVKELLGTGKDFQKIFNPLQNQPTNRYLKTIMKEQDSTANK